MSSIASSAVHRIALLALWGLSLLALVVGLSGCMGEHTFYLLPAPIIRDFGPQAWAMECWLCRSRPWPAR
jgi:hypothetical protein